MDPYSGKVPVGIQKVIANGSSLETLRYRVLNFVIIFLFPDLEPLQNVSSVFCRNKVVGLRTARSNFMPLIMDGRFCCFDFSKVLYRAAVQHSLKKLEIITFKENLDQFHGFFFYLQYKQVF